MKVIDKSSNISLDYKQELINDIIDNGRRESKFGIHELSKKEREVFYLFIDGSSPTEISKKLKQSPRTTESHLRKIREKCGFKSMISLVIAFYKEIDKGNMLIIEEKVRTVSKTIIKTKEKIIYKEADDKKTKKMREEKENNLRIQIDYWKHKYIKVVNDKQELKDKYEK